MNKSLFCVTNSQNLHQPFPSKAREHYALWIVDKYDWFYEPSYQCAGVRLLIISSESRRAMSTVGPCGQDAPRGTAKPGRSGVRG